MTRSYLLCHNRSMFRSCKTCLLEPLGIKFRYKYLYPLVPRMELTRSPKSHTELGTNTVVTTILGFSSRFLQAGIRFFFDVEVSRLEELQMFIGRGGLVRPRRHQTRVRSEAVVVRSAVSVSAGDERHERDAARAVPGRRVRGRAGRRQLRPAQRPALAAQARP